MKIVFWELKTTWFPQDCHIWKEFYETQMGFFNAYISSLSEFPTKDFGFSFFARPLKKDLL